MPLYLPTYNMHQIYVLLIFAVSLEIILSILGVEEVALGWSADGLFLVASSRPLLYDENELY
jgi:hypothetical protein